MTEDCEPVPVYEITADARRPPWVSRAFIRYVTLQHQVPRASVLPMLVVALITLGLHACLLGSVILESRTAHHRLDREGAGATAMAGAYEPVMTLILVSTSEGEADSSEPPSSHGLTDKDLALRVISPDPRAAYGAAPLRWTG
jgi:hypothetical protein